MPKRNFILFVAFMLLWAGVTSAHAEAMRFQHFTDIDGLSSNTVRCIYQDNMGYIWAGTNGGLNRFNSFHFTKFYSAKQDDKYIGNNNIYCITDETPTSRNRIWIGTVDGIYIFDNTTHNFSRLPIVVDGKELSNTLVFTMSPDYDGNMWIGTLGQGLLRYNLATQTFSQYDAQSHPRIFERNTVAKIIVDEEHNIWIGLGGSYICRYNAEQDDLTPFKVEDSISRQTISRVSTIYEDIVGNIWVAGLAGDLFLFDRANNRFTRNMPGFTCDRIRSIIERKPGVLLLGTNQGIVSFDVRERSFKMVDNGRTGHDYALKDNFIYSIEKDTDGGIWVGTYYGGLSYMSSGNDAFSTPEIPKGSGHIISCFCEDESGRIWIGSDDGGLCTYDPATQEYRSHPLNYTLGNLNIHSLLIHDGYLWIGTVINGLYRYDLRSGGVKKIAIDNTDDDDVDIYSLHCDSHGTLWIGTTQSVCRYNKSTQKIETVFKTSYNSRVSSICEDAFDNVWFATNGNGLLRYSHSDKEIKRFDKNADLNGYPYINTLSADGDNIWIGTAGQGLLRYDIAKNHLTREFNNKDYDISTIFKIIPSGNELWITTNNGMINYRYGQTEKSMVRYASDDGLSTNIFNLNAGLKSSTGYIYVGSNNGFDRFYPYDLKNHVQHSNAEVVVTNLTLSGIKPDSKTVYHTIPKEGISVRTNKLSIALSFIALNYSSPQRTVYRFRMANFDKNWSETDPYIHSGERRISYTNLPPNTYRFEVCCSRNGEDFSQPTSFEIEVLPPWWMTSAMIAIYILLGIALVVVVLYFINRYFDKKHQEDVEQLTQRKDLEILKAKYARFTDRVSEFYMPLSLIIAPAEKIARHEDLSDDVRKDAEMIQRNCNKLLTMVDNISDSTINNAEPTSDSPALQQQADDNTTTENKEAIRLPDIRLTVEPDAPKSSLLLVDEDSEFTDFFIRYFTPYYFVDTVKEYNEALARLTDKHFDIVLADWRIGDATGHELCNAIRQDKMIDDTPIIILTKDGSAQVKSAALASGADLCLDKWASPDFAARQIHAIIKSRQNLRTKYSKMPYINSGKDDQSIVGNRFMVQVNAYVMDNIANSAITAEDMASAVNMSRTLFFTRIKQMTGLTPNEFLRSTRLKKAAELLAGDNKLRVTEICYMVGFSSTSYFAKCFQAEYGMLPNQYMEQHRQ